MDYRYIGYTENRKIVKGTLTADSQEVAAQALARQGYRVVSLEPVATMMSLEKLLPSLFRIKPTEVIMFSRQLALLLESGVDIVSALELLQGQVSGKGFRKVLGEVVTDLRSGSSLAAAMAKHSQAFGSIYYKMVAVGERTGGLEVVLRQMADYTERESTVIKKVKSALMYPAIVVLLAIGVLVMLIAVALPPLMSMFTSLGTELPLPTRLLLGVSNFLNAYGLHLLVGMVVAAFLLFFWVRQPAGRYYLDKLLLTVPVIGRISLLTELSRFSRSMSLLFRAGLPLPEIMTMVIQVSNNKVISQALTDIKQQMLKGEGLAKPMAANKLFPPLMVQMVKVGEETGNLDSSLITVAEAYEVEANDRTSSLITLIEPAMTVFIGLVVAFIALSMFMPMYSILGSVG